MIQMLAGAVIPHFKDQTFNDVLVVFNFGNNTDHMRETPALPHSDTRTFVVKYTNTFVLTKR